MALTISELTGAHTKRSTTTFPHGRRLHRVRQRRARGRGVFITKEYLGSYVQDRTKKRFTEFGCSYLKSGEAGYMFPFALPCAIILPMHRAKGVRP